MRTPRRLWSVRGMGTRLCIALALTVMAVGVGRGQASPAASASSATADSVLDARTREVASQLRCPVCQGLSLQDSPSELSQQMRDLVRQQLAAGKTPDEVKQYFVDRYGVWILMEPPKQGFSGLVYVIPLMMLLVGAIVILLAVRRWTALREKPAPPSQETPTTSGMDPVTWSVEPAQKPG